MTALTGTPILLRLATRRDRIKLPIWIYGSAVAALYFAIALKRLYPDEKSLSGLVVFLRIPAGVVLTGPGYGLDNPTRPGMFAAVYALYVLLIVALMNVALVVRHTRAEEAAGRTDLLRAGALSPLAPLATAVVMAVAADVAAGVLIAVALCFVFPVGGSILFGLCALALGLCFAGVTAVVVQVLETSRAAMSLGCALVAGAVVVRGLGDVLHQHGSWLSWFSPFAWAQQTRVYVDGRLWPLIPCFVVAIAGFAVAAVIQRRRDVGAGLLAPQPGRPTGSRWLADPLTLYLRLERTALIWWAVGLLIVGLAYGSMTGSIRSAMANLPATIEHIVSNGSADFINGYVGLIALIDALLASACALVVMHRLTVEETDGRAEVVHARAVSRTTWLGSGLATAVLGGVLGLLASGFGMGLATAIALGEPSRIGQSFGAHAAYLPAVLITLAVGALGFSVRPGLVAVGWVVVAFGAITSMFKTMIDLPAWVFDLSPFWHVSTVPAGPVPVTALVVSAVVALLVAVAALLLYRRRDLTG